MSLVDCGNNLILNWSTILVISVAPKEVPVVTLSAQDKVKLLRYLKSGFKQTIKWKKCQSKASIESEIQKFKLEFCKTHSKKPVPESLFYSLRPVTLLKYSPWHWCFPVSSANTFVRTPFFGTLSVAASVKAYNFTIIRLCQGCYFWTDISNSSRS